MKCSVSSSKLKISVFSLLLCFAASALVIMISPMQAYAYNDDMIGIQYDTPVKCGQQTIFNLSATNGSTECMYYVKNVEMKVDGVWTPEVNCTFFKYVDESRFGYTFATSGDYRITFGLMDKSTTPIVTATRQIQFTISDPDAPSLESQADRVVAAATASGCKSDYDYALYFHDYLINSNKYDKVSRFFEDKENNLAYVGVGPSSFQPGMTMGATGTLVRGYGTCESFHRSMTMLCQRVGIQAIRVESRSVRTHVWTCAQLDGRWVQLDATWDCNGYSGNTEFMKHLYFGVPDDLMTTVTPDWEKCDNYSGALPQEPYAATSYEDNYFMASGDIQLWTDLLKTYINANLKDNPEIMIDPLDAFASLPVEYRLYYPDVYRIIYPVAAYAMNKESSTLGYATAYTLGTQENCQDSRFKVTKNPIVQYTLSFNSQGGSEVEGITADKGTIINNFATPTKDGHDFLGWFDAAEGSNRVESVELTENTTLYAHWQHQVPELTRYTLTFDSCGGSSVSPITNVEGTSITYLPTPTRQGHDFLGWFSAASGGNKIESVELNDNITVYAHWNKTVVDISAATISQIPNQKWNGSKRTPAFTVMLDNKTLTPNTDYTYLFTNNRNPGSAVLTVIGAGGYTGMKTATFRIGIVISFDDVNSSTPHAEDIKWLGATEVSTGFVDGTFRGMNSVIRQDMAAFLYRLAGSPDYTPTAQEKKAFVDVNESTPHAKEIWWLAKTGISTGWTEPNGAKTFRPTADVLRQDMAAFLHRTANYIGCGGASGTQTISFADVNSTTPHAEDIKWLAKTGISTGYLINGKHYFQGTVNVFRQDMAAFLHRTDSLREQQ